MQSLRIAALVFMASIVSLFLTFPAHGFLSPPGNPGVERPVVPADVFVYTFETSAFVLAAIGVTAVIVSVPMAQQRLSSYLAIVFSWIAVVFFMFITLGRQEQVQIFEAGRSDLLLDGRLAGWQGFYSAGHLFFAAGIVMFSLTVFRTKLTGRALSVVGFVLGGLLAVAAYARLVFGRETVSDGYLTPFLFIMIWLFVLGVLFYRRSRAGVTTTD
jgi:hypothetical protein